MNDRASSSVPHAGAAARALAAAGEIETARDVGAIDAAARAARIKRAPTRRGLVERLICGPAPDVAELGAGARAFASASTRGQAIAAAALDCLARGQAFTADGRLSDELRRTVTREHAYGYTVPAEFGGLGASYAELAALEETLAANGLAPLAVEISGELTIGAGSLLAYGTDEQRRTFLPLIAGGALMGFALTEVGVGVNAKKIAAYVEPDADGGFRLFADGDRNKLYITNATHGSLVAIAARLGRAGADIGLFIVRLPDKDCSRADGADYEFRSTPTGVEAFRANHNARLHFHNFPIPASNQIPADGVEALFYSLGLGRAMLAAMSAGCQRMLAADAAAYARVRDGVGGRVIAHELPRLQIGRILGGALTARALAHLTLAELAAGADITGLRDLTKSAAAAAALESMVAAERVLGGRAFQQGSRVNDARPNLHVFGIVEGEDDLILMGMVKDVMSPFTDRYFADILDAVASINKGPDGQPLPSHERVLRLGVRAIARHPGRTLAALVRIAGRRASWSLAGWCAGQALVDVVRLPRALVPSSLLARYRALPRPLRRHARFAERRLRRLRWTFLSLNVFFQLELTRAQVPLSRLGRTIELLVSMLAVCHHAAQADESERRVAALQCELLRVKLRGPRLATGLFDMQRLRSALAAVGDDVERGTCSLLADIAPEPFAHPWSETR